MLIAVEIEKLGQLYEVVAILAAVYSDHKTACRRGEVVILVQREAVEAEGIFEDASVLHADRFDQPPRAAWILCPTRDAARIGVQLFALMDMLPGREEYARRLTDRERYLDGGKTNSTSGNSFERRRMPQGMSHLFKLTRIMSHST